MSSFFNPAYTLVTASLATPRALAAAPAARAATRALTGSITVSLPIIACLGPDFRRFVDYEANG
jgi:hypothetical protein